jgi:hypothetical protein
VSQPFIRQDNAWMHCIRAFVVSGHPSGAYVSESDTLCDPFCGRVESTARSGMFIASPEGVAMRHWPRGRWPELSLLRVGRHRPGSDLGSAARPTTAWRWSARTRAQRLARLCQPQAHGPTQPAASGGDLSTVTPGRAAQLDQIIDLLIYAKTARTSGSASP